MRKLLKSIRATQVINYPIRKGIKLMHLLQRHWPVSGVIKCQFEDIPFKIYNKCDDPITSYFYYNIPFHENVIFRLMKFFSRKTKTIIDIGANTGVHSVIASIANPECKIISVEPFAPNLKRFRKNIEVNGCTNITVVDKALGSTNGELKFFVPSDDRITDVSSAVDKHGNRIYPELQWKETTVSQITFDEMVASTDKIDFFKCDVEGFEMEVMNGAKGFFAKNRPPFILEICLSEEKCRYFNDFAKQHGYHIYHVNSNGLYYLDAIYEFDNWPNFLFTTYKDKHPFIPFKDMEAFVEKCTQNNSI